MPQLFYFILSSWCYSNFVLFNFFSCFHHIKIEQRQNRFLEKVFATDEYFCIKIRCGFFILTTRHMTKTSIAV